MIVSSNIGLIALVVLGCKIESAITQYTWIIIINIEDYLYLAFFNNIHKSQLKGLVWKPNINTWQAFIV